MEGMETSVEVLSRSDATEQVEVKLGLTSDVADRIQGALLLLSESSQSVWRTADQRQMRILLDFAARNCSGILGWSAAMVSSEPAHGDSRIDVAVSEALRAEREAHAADRARFVSEHVAAITHQTRSEVLETMLSRLPPSEKTREAALQKEHDANVAEKRALEAEKRTLEVEARMLHEKASRLEEQLRSEQHSAVDALELKIKMAVAEARTAAETKAREDMDRMQAVVTQKSASFTSMQYEYARVREESDRLRAELSKAREERLVTLNNSSKLGVEGEADVNGAIIAAVGSAAVLTITRETPGESDALLRFVGAASVPLRCVHASRRKRDVRRASHTQPLMLRSLQLQQPQQQLKQQMQQQQTSRKRTRAQYAQSPSQSSPLSQPPSQSPSQSTSQLQSQLQLQMQMPLQSQELDALVVCDAIVESDNDEEDDARTLPDLTVNDSAETQDAEASHAADSKDDEDDKEEDEVHAQTFGGDICLKIETKNRDEVRSEQVEKFKREIEKSTAQGGILISLKCAASGCVDGVLGIERLSDGRPLIVINNFRAMPADKRIVYMRHVLKFALDLAKLSYFHAELFLAQESSFKDRIADLNLDLRDIQASRFCAQTLDKTLDAMLKRCFSKLEGLRQSVVAATADAKKYGTAARESAVVQGHAEALKDVCDVFGVDSRAIRAKMLMAAPTFSIASANTSANASAITIAIAPQKGFGACSTPTCTPCCGHGYSGSSSPPSLFST